MEKQVLATLPSEMTKMAQAIFTEFDDDLRPLLN